MKNISPLIISLLAATLIEKFSMYLVFPFLSLYLMNEFHYTGLDIGIILSATGIVGIIMSLISGWFIDNFNQKYLIYLGISINIISFLLFPTITSYHGFIIFNIVTAIGISIIDPIYRLLIVNLSDVEQKKLIFNIRYYLINIAAATGPLVAGQLIFLGVENLFYIVSAFFLINLILFIYCFRKYGIPLKSKVEKSESINITIPIYIFKNNHAFLFLILGSIFIIFGTSQINSTLPQYMGSIFPYKEAAKYFSYILMINAVTVLLCQFLIYKSSQFISTSLSLIIGAILLSVGIFMFGLSPSIYVFGIGMFIYTLGEMFYFTMWDIKVDEISEAHLKGTYYSLSGLNGISRIIAPVIGGYLLDSISNGTVIFSILALITAVSCVFLYLSKHKSRPIEN